jgi:hypothetical protein
LAARGEARQAPGARPAAAQPATGEAEFTIFVNGAAVGSEQVQLARDGNGWIITATGRSAPPIEFTINRFEMRYGADWQPVELKFDAAQRDRALQIATSFGVTTAINEITQSGATASKTDQISARTVVLPNNCWAAYEALAARLAGARSGAEIPVYVAAQAEITLAVTGVTVEQLAMPGRAVATRRYDLVFRNPGGPLEATIVVDDRSRFVRLDIPSASFAVVRSDAAGVGTRQPSLRNPTDADVTVPGNGFNLAGTLTTPPGAAGRLRYPAVVLVGGSGPVDRDETIAGIPLFGQLAGALAQSGFIVLRYDKRGIGQSGGRTETATLANYAEDVVAAVKWVEKRKDVDKRRVAVAGHGEGAAAALLAAAREKKIASLVLLAAPGTTGADLILEQQRHVLDVLNVSAEERRQKIDLQKKIQAAVVAGSGWEAIPDDLREQADTPWFRSLLTFDPAAVMPRVKQPILIVHGELDTQVLPRHADLLAGMARARKKAPAVDVVHLPGVNHLLVRAATGEVSEYGSLPEKTISPEVATRIAEWLKK